MTSKYIRYFGAMAIVASFAVASEILAQDNSTVSEDVLVLDPLFEYPQAPEEMQGLQERSEWVVTHFWDPMDFKSKKTVDQTLLNHAFGVFVVPIQWSDKVVVSKSIDQLLKKLKKNPALSFQFTKAAEETIYGPNSSIWIDEVYLKFLEQALQNKKLPKRQLDKWSRQYRELSKSQIGMVAPRFRFINSDGEEKEYFPMSTPTILAFGNLKDPDTRLEILRSSSNIEMTRMLENGKVNILFIDMVSGTPDYSSLPSRWVGGKVKDISTIEYDTRSYPVYYIVGSDGKITRKVLTLPEAFNEIRTMSAD